MTYAPTNINPKRRFVTSLSIAPVQLVDYDFKQPGAATCTETSKARLRALEMSGGATPWVLRGGGVRRQPDARLIALTRHLKSSIADLTGSP